MVYLEIVDCFVAYHKSVCHTEKTISNYLYLLKMFDSVVKPADYCNLCYSDIVTFQKYIDNRGLSISTVGNYFRHLKSFVHWLEEYDYLKEKGLYRKIKLPRMPKKNIKIYSDIEIKQIYECVHTESNWLTVRNKLIISLMLDSGLRQNEVCMIKNLDIDFVNEMINVHGKGNKDRFVPIGKHTLRYMKEYSLICPFDNEYLLVNRRGDRLTNNAVKLFVSKIKDCLGFEFSSHKLRHNFATNYLLDHYEKYGYFDTYTLMILLGHEDIVTTDRYVHFVKQYIATRRRVSHLDKVFSECEDNG